MLVEIEFVAISIVVDPTLAPAGAHANDASVLPTPEDVIRETCSEAVEFGKILGQELLHELPILAEVSEDEEQDRVLSNLFMMVV